MSTQRILVVDDDPSVTRNLKLTLETSGGYEVFTENDAGNALAAARSFPPGFNLVGRDNARPGRRRRCLKAAGRPVAPRHPHHLSDRACFQQGNRRPRDVKRDKHISRQASGHRRAEKNGGGTHSEVTRVNGAGRALGTSANIDR